MAELELFNNDQLLRRYTLHQGGISIGRAPDNQIQLDSPAVNERHARVFTVGRSSVIQDLSSDSGTYINNIEIGRQTLRHDDVVQIGGYRLRFLADESERAAVPVSPEPPVETQAPAAVTDKIDQPAPPPEDNRNNETITQAETAPEPVVPELPAEESDTEQSAPQAEPEANKGNVESDTTEPAEPETPATPSVAEPATQAATTKRVDTELKARAVEDVLDDFETTLASEVDLDLIVDSQSLLETTEDVLSQEPEVVGQYAAGDPADDPKPIPDFGEPTDDMVDVVNKEREQEVETAPSTVAGQEEPGEDDTVARDEKDVASNVVEPDITQAPTVTKDTESPTAQAATQTAEITEETPATTDKAPDQTGEDEEDPVAAAIRARIQAKVSANARLQKELGSMPEVGSGSPPTPDEVEAEEANATDSSESDAAAPADAQDDPDTILEFLPEPRHLAKAEPQPTAEPVAQTQTTTEENEVPRPPRREQSVELPAPPEWSIEGEDPAAAGDAVALTIAGETGQGAQYGAVDIMNGPNAGQRVWLGKPRTILGNHQDRAVIIERHPTGFRVSAAHRGNTVTVNGTLLLSTPENLQNGDHIEFANMGLKFVLTDVRPAHPNELAQQESGEDADQPAQNAQPAPASPQADLPAEPASE